MHQDRNRFSVRASNGISARHKGVKTLLLCCVATDLPRAPADNRAGKQDSQFATQDKVLVIMDDGIFWKQAYRGTGSQKDSTIGVTCLVQRVISILFLCGSAVVAQFPVSP
jgi:hypothetical protein